MILLETSCTILATCLYCGPNKPHRIAIYNAEIHTDAAEDDASTALRDALDGLDWKDGRICSDCAFEHRKELAAMARQDD